MILQAAQPRAEALARHAVRALLYEVAVTPKPGLVDRADAGAHRDMDFFTFLDSAAALPPYFETCALAGLQAGRAERSGSFRRLDTLLEQLRGDGKLAEEKMLCATGGVNTHKGAIFLLGILTAAAGYVLGSDERGAGTPEDRAADADAGQAALARTERILLAAGRIAAPACRELEQGGESTGLVLYRTTGCTGVRGEAAAGFPSLRDYALPALRKARKEGASLNDAGVAALLELILHVEDTTLLKRCKSAEAVETERSYLRELLKTMTPAEAARRLNVRWSKRGFSAGGCADLLGAALFLRFIEDDCHV